MAAARHNDADELADESPVDALSPYGDLPNFGGEPIVIELNGQR